MARLYKLLEKVGIEEQFGFQPTRSTADAQFIIKNTLQTGRAHELPTYTLFVDLVTAFDTANRDLLYAILAKCGVPLELISAIKRLHTQFHLEFKLDKMNKCLIENSIGVKQGDNAAGILFLFLIQAVATSKKTSVRTRDSPDLQIPCPTQGYVWMYSFPDSFKDYKRDPRQI